MDVGRRIQELRTGRKMSQFKLAQLVEVEASYISRVEHGHIVPRLPNLERIAAGLGMTLAQFFYEPTLAGANGQGRTAEADGKGDGGDGGDDSGR